MAKIITKEFIEFEFNVKKELQILDNLNFSKTDCDVNDCDNTYTKKIIIDIDGIEKCDFVEFACDKHLDKLGELI